MSAMLSKIIMKRRQKKDEYESDVVQVKRVVDSLVTSLDMQYEVSVQLYNIYLVMQRYLVKADCKKG